MQFASVHSASSNGFSTCPASLSLEIRLDGYDYASEKAGATTGWTFPIFEEAFNQGYPQELTHFVDCVRNGKKPVSDGEYGKAVMEIIHAAYVSAKKGCKVELPYSSDAAKPVDNWR